MQFLTQKNKCPHLSRLAIHQTMQRVRANLKANRIA